MAENEVKECEWCDQDGIVCYDKDEDYEEVIACDDHREEYGFVCERPVEDDGLCGTCQGSGGGDYPMHCTACGGSGMDRCRSSGRDEEPPDRFEDDYWDPRWDP